MAKIKTEHWLFPIKIDTVFQNTTGTSYTITDGFSWYKTVAGHGTTQGIAICPCCGEESQIYIWSFIGGGKRCTTCNVFLGSGGAFVEYKDIKHLQITDSEILKG